MDLSPSDIRNQEFSGQLRGYSKDAVDDFKEQVATAFEMAKQEQLKLTMEVESLKTQLSGLKQFEDTIKNAAIDARRHADMTIMNAKQEAELILTKARAESEKVIENRASKIVEIEAQITKLELARKSYLSKLKNLLTSHLELVKEVTSSGLERKSKEELLEVTESSEVNAKTRETIATQPSQPEAIETEEANAPGEIKAVTVEEQGATAQPVAEKETASPIDPELATALASYKRSMETGQDEMPPEVSEEQSYPKQGEVVETTARAEDIPQGFVAMTDDVDTNATDKEVQAPTTMNQPVEQASAGVDDPPTEEKPVSPEELAKSLDEVAAKFEEEMDKAAKR